MMVWENTDNELVKLCNEFRKSVVAEFSKNPEIEQKLLGAFTKEDLAQFEKLSKQAFAKSAELQQQNDADGELNQNTLRELDEIVLDMSEQHARLSLGVLGKEKLQTFVKPENRTQELSDRYAEKNYKSLAIIFAP